VLERPVEAENVDRLLSFAQGAADDSLDEGSFCGEVTYRDGCHQISPRRRSSSRSA